MDSILNSVKKVLGIDEGYTAFDTDIIMHINSMLAIVNDLGIGPAEGFVIEDAEPTWDDFLGVGNPKFNDVKTYIYLRVRLLFDSSSLTSYALEAIKEQYKEIEWRLNVRREDESWVSPS